MYSRRDFVKSLAAALLVAGGASDCARSDRVPRSSADIIVYGATSAGVTAAVQAARMGYDVILVEPGRSIGGMTTSGLGATDISSPTYCSGLALEFYRRVYRYYGRDEAWRFERRASYVARRPAIRASLQAVPIWHRFEPHAAARVFDDMLREARVTVLTGRRLDLARGVERVGRRIVSLTMLTGEVISGEMFIDATYEGDLLASAGVRTIVGREANDVYGETLNGVRPGAALAIDPHVSPGDERSGLLPGIQGAAPGPAGSADGRVQAYNFRLCLTDKEENAVPFPKPRWYNSADYEAIGRVFAQNGRRGGLATLARFARSPSTICEFASYTPLPNCKVDANTGPGPLNLDPVGLSYGWAEGGYAQREEIWGRHAEYMKGLMWFAANDSRAPEVVRLQTRRWGLAADEFPESDNWPPLLYVREARRMVSDCVMTERHAFGEEAVRDGVAVASYRLDCHRVSYYRGADGQLETEGGLFVSSRPFAISYRAIRPNAGQCTNVTAACCVSASHVAYSSIRMEPVYMMLGQAAATACCLALGEGFTVQELPYVQLRRQLLRDGLTVEPVDAQESPLS